MDYVKDGEFAKIQKTGFMANPAKAGFPLFQTLFIFRFVGRYVFWDFFGTVKDVSHMFPFFDALNLKVFSIFTRYAGPPVPQYR